MPVYFTGQTGPALPLNSVQYNSGPGQFAGDANLTWIPASGLTNKKHMAVGSNAVIDNGSPLYPGDNYPVTFGIENTLTDLSAAFTVELQILSVVAPSVNSASDSFGVYHEVRSVAGNTNLIGSYTIHDSRFNHLADVPLTRFRGHNFALLNSGNANIAEATVTRSFVENDGSGTITDSVSFNGWPAFNFGTGTITSAAAFRAESPDNSGGGTVNFSAAFHALNQTLTGGNSYAFYYAAPSNKEFWVIADGTVRVGSLTASRPVFTDASKNLISAQGASVADATDNATAITQLNALISRLEGLNILATV